MVNEIIIVKGIPVSVNASGRSKAQWRQEVANVASQIFTDTIPDSDLRIRITYFCNGIPVPDLDNISKPICDALKGIVFEDDNCQHIMERHARFRDINGPFHIKGIPPELAVALSEGDDFVCIEISNVGNEVLIP